MSAAGRAFVTPHAVEQFLRHVAPGFDTRGALSFLIHAAETARPTPTRYRDAEVWRADSLHGRIRLVVMPAAPDEGRTLPQVVTVLAACDSLDGRRAVPR